MKPFALDQALPRGVALLEASAGTGKTYSIAGLTLRLIAEEGIPVDQLLIVTFTRAATAELADRIHRRLLAGARDLREHLAGAPVNADDPVMRALCTGVDVGELRERLRRLELAIASFDEAAISTIHSFCQRSLQRAAFESSTDFDADMEAELGPLLEECVDDFMASEMIDLPLDFYSILRKGQQVDREHLLALAHTLSSDAQVRVLPESPGDPVRAFLDARNAFVAEWSASGADFVQALVKQRAKRGPDKLELGNEYTKGKLAKVVATLDDYVDALERDTFVPPQLSSALHGLARTRLDDKLSSGELPESLSVGIYTKNGKTIVRDAVLRDVPADEEEE